jgi:hypothetical protein
MEINGRILWEQGRLKGLWRTKNQNIKDSPEYG